MRLQMQLVARGTGPFKGAAGRASWRQGGLALDPDILAEIAFAALPMTALSVTARPQSGGIAAFF